jgi:hypothetical protein
VGFRRAEGGSAAVYLGFGTTYAESVSYYDNIGSSYASDSLIFFGGLPAGLEGVTGIGAFLRPYSQFGDPSRLCVYKETNGFYASGWNTIGDDNSKNEFAIGNHGELRQHLTAFGDGHASAVLFDVRTNVSGFTDDGPTHTAGYTQRGGTIEKWALNPPELDLTYGAPGMMGRFLYSGPGWKDHAFPAPAVVMPTPL